MGAVEGGGFFLRDRNEADKVVLGGVRFDCSVKLGPSYMVHGMSESERERKREN